MSVQDMITDYKELVIKFLEEITEIRRCPFHSDYLYRTYNYDEEQIYAIVTARIKQMYDDNKINYVLFHDAVKEVLDELGDSSDCPICATNIDKIMKE